METNVMRTFFYTAQAGGQIINLGLPDNKPKRIKIQLTGTNTNLTQRPFYLISNLFQDQRIYGRETIGATNNPIKIDYEFTNDRLIDDTQRIETRNGATNAELTQGFITLVFNFYY